MDEATLRPGHWLKLVLCVCPGALTLLLGTYFICHLNILLHGMFVLC